MRQAVSDESCKNLWKLKKLVLPQHTDHAGVMWHGAYLNWLEEARAKALNESGISYRDLSWQGFEMSVVSLSINYKIPLIHGDEVVLKSWVFPKKGPRWPWKTIFLKTGEVSAAEAEIDLVLIKKVNNQNKLLRKEPSFLSQVFLNLQKGSNL